MGHFRDITAVVDDEADINYEGLTATVQQESYQTPKEKPFIEEITSPSTILTFLAVLALYEGGFYGIGKLVNKRRENRVIRAFERYQRTNEESDFQEFGKSFTRLKTRSAGRVMREYPDISRAAYRYVEQYHMNKKI